MKVLNYPSVLIIVLSVWGGYAHADPYIELGPAYNLALDQPRVAVEVYIPDPEHSFGPDIFNTFLLDTAAQGLLVGGFAYEEMAAEGYQIEGTFQELGIAGLETYDVSAVYNFDFANSVGARQTLTDVRLMSHATANFGFSGIVGMPAMVGRITTMDMTPMAEFDFISVDFPTALPPSNGHRYTVPLTLVDFPPPEQPSPGGPLPTYAPIPTLNAELSTGSQTASATFLLDTGAQMSIISTSLAFAAGLDKNGNGTLDDEAIRYELVGGVGGSALFPVLAADKLTVATAEGVDLIWTDLEVLVADIHPDIEAIFSCDPLTSGYVPGFLGDGLVGYIEQVYLDFTDAGNLSGTMLLDLNGEYDNVVPEPASLALLAIGVVALLKRRAIC